MQFRREMLVAAVSLVLFAGGTSCVGAVDLKGFDFKYGQEGDRALLPVQVFDDGDRTYFQFPSNASLPIISATTGSGRKMLAPLFKQPYVVVEGVFPSFLLTSKDGGRALVTYSGITHGPMENTRGRQGEVAQRPTQQVDSLYARALPATATASGFDEGDPLMRRIREMLNGGQDQPSATMQAAQARADRIPVATYYGEAGSTPLAVAASRSSTAAGGSFNGRFDRDVYASARDQIANPVKANSGHGTESLVLTFAGGSSELGGAGARQVSSFANELTQSQRIRVLLFSERGAKPQVGSARAAAVKNLLVTFGVPVGNIDIRIVAGTDDVGTAELTVVEEAAKRPSIAAAQDAGPATAQGDSGQPQYIVDLRSRQAREEQPEVRVPRREMSAPASNGFNSRNMLRAEFNGGGAFQKTGAAPDGATSVREELQSIMSFYERRLITREQAEGMIRKLAEQSAQARPAANQQPTAAGGALFGAPEATGEKWEIRLDDKTLRRAMERWGKATGYQVSWEAPVDFPVRLEATFVGRFEDAVKAVMLSLRDTQTPMEAFVYDNRVVRIVPQGTKSPNK